MGAYSNPEKTSTLDKLGVKATMGKWYYLPSATQIIYKKEDFQRSPSSLRAFHYSELIELLKENGLHPLEDSRDANALAEALIMQLQNKSVSK